MINYIGNKSTLSDFILANCPKNPDYWIEPFGGMAGLYFSLNLKDYPDTKFIYNDINPFNSNLFEQMKKDKFIKKVLDTKVTLQLFLESYDKLTSRSKEDKALAWLIILVCADIKDVMGKQFKGSSHFEMFKYKLPHYKEYYKRLIVHNMDYKKLFQKYDNGANVFFYCDPPYRSYEAFYTNHNFTDDSHGELRDSLLNLKSSWILSYYDFPEMKEWYKDYKIISKKHNLGIEYLILNV
jgi:DNA adenine methylase